MRTFSVPRALLYGVIPALCVWLAACTPLRNAPEPRPPAGAGAVLTVTSEEVVPIRLYAVTTQGTRWPLGELRPQSTMSVLLPPGILLPAEVRFEGVAVGHGTRGTGFAMVFPGDRLRVILRSAEHLSTLLRQW